MSHQSSTGLRNAMVAAMAAALANGRIDVYSGPPPASADDAPTGTLLLQVSKADGSPLSMPGPGAGGLIRKPVGDVWRGTVIATGKAGYYRYVATDDSGAPSLTAARMQGRVGEVDAELIMSNVNLVAGAPQDVKDYNFIVPTY